MTLPPHPKTHLLVLFSLSSEAGLSFCIYCYMRGAGELLCLLWICCLESMQFNPRNPCNKGGRGGKFYKTSAGETETGRDLGATGVKLILFGDLQVQ